MAARAGGLGEPLAKRIGAREPAEIAVLIRAGHKERHRRVCFLTLRHKRSGTQCYRRGCSDNDMFCFHVPLPRHCVGDK